MCPKFSHSHQYSEMPILLWVRWNLRNVLPFLLSTAASVLQGMAYQPHAGSFPAATQLLLPLFPNETLSQFLQQPIPTLSLNSRVKITAGQSWSQLLLASRPPGQWDMEKDGKCCLCLGQLLLAGMHCGRTRACCALCDDCGKLSLSQPEEPFYSCYHCWNCLIFLSLWIQLKGIGFIPSSKTVFHCHLEGNPLIFTMEKIIFQQTLNPTSPHPHILTSLLHVFQVLC